MTEDRPAPSARSLSGRTAWARNLQTPLRVFLRTETGSAAVLVAMTVAALVWINVSASSYEAVWGARLSVQLAGAGVSLDLREWVNSGLMTFFSSCSGWRPGASSTWVSCGSGGGWRCRCWPGWVA